MGHQFSPKICLFVVATFLFLGYKVNSKTSEYIARRVFAYQREVPRPDVRPPEGRSGRAKSSDNGKQIICINGKVMYHKCVCKLDYFGEHCESKMFCNGFEREMNLSCVACDDNYSGERCDHPKCRNGGVQHTSEQRCQCLQPYSGDFCETLKVEDVYRFYNTKAIKCWQNN
uniref:EGF-like domain-containing protein n=1 Tax=Globodera pallida TaxID=36090 RepID=A0A183CPE8_GLOPA